MTASGLARRLAHDRRGSTIIEFGLIFTPLLTLIFGGIEVGRIMWVQNALMYSTDEAARCASVSATTCGTPTQVQTFAAGRAGAGFTTADFTATVDSCGNHVVGTHTVTINIPFLSRDINLSADACYPK